MRFTILFAIALLSTAALADVTVQFSEGAPTDRFTISAFDTCLTKPIQLKIDLNGSDAGLVFDVTAAGAGVEVFQPFKLVSGDQFVTGYSPLADGDKSVILDIASLTSAGAVAFTTDLDDTIGQREITVSGAEIAGATVTLMTEGQRITAPFGTDAIARLATRDCGT